ncbi:MAG: hypothetical protein IJW45_04780 [Oscillospiraceae bacterium]|nr:hypothetical protein [Oscillospiraceae bacterium]
MARCESNIAYPGYLVKLDTGDLGTVTRRMFVCEGSDECAFIEDVASVFEVVAVWGQVYTREATHADP